MAIGCCKGSQTASPVGGAHFRTQLERGYPPSRPRSGSSGSDITVTHANTAGDDVLDRQDSDRQDSLTKNASLPSLLGNSGPSWAGSGVKTMKSNASGGSWVMKKTSSTLSTGTTRSSSQCSELMEGGPEFRILRKLTTIDMQFPMYVISVRDMLQLTEVRPHQQLKRMDKLVEYRKGMAVTFVSHQWTGATHPDEDMSQFKVLQDMFRNLVRGKTRIGVCPLTTMLTGRMTTYTDMEDLKNLDDMYIWYDYFSIMQPSAEDSEDDVGLADRYLLRAVNSIPAYVELSSHFIALTPGLLHNETGEEMFYTSWLSRGWCRAEHTAWCMTGRPILVVLGPMLVVEAFINLQCVFHAPYRGSFGIEADRGKVDAMMRTMLDNRVARLQEEGRKVFVWRFMKALGQHYVRRDGYETDLQMWMEGYQFDSPTKQSTGKSWRPIHYAAMEGNIEIMKVLAGMGVSANSTTARAAGHLFMFRKMTPAAIAILYTPEWVGLPMLKLLVEFKANLHARDGQGQTLLQLACLGADNNEVIEYLLDQGLDINAKTKEGNTALHISCLSGRAEHCQLLIKRGASLTETNELKQGMLVSASPFGSSGTVEALLLAGAEPDAEVPASTRARIFSSLANIGLKVKPQVVVGFIIKNNPGLTPLMLAAFMGDFGSVNSLLLAGADPEKTNHCGLNAVGFCRLGCGSVQIHELLERAKGGVVTI